MKILILLSNIQAENIQETQYTDITVDWHKHYVENGEALTLFDARRDNFTFNSDSGVKREDMLYLIERLIMLYK